MRALICDLDGTLADLGIDWDDLRERVRRLLGTDHPMRPIASSIPEAARTEEEAERAYRLVESAEMEAASRASADPELIEAISRLRRAGVRFAVVTMQGRRPAREALRRLGLLDMVDVLITREDSLSRREQLEMALERLGVEPQEAVFAGDSPWDASAGRLLGCLTLGVGERARGADLSFPSIREALEYVLSLL